MEFKVVAVITLLCLTQSISSKAVGGLGSFWGANPFLAANPFFAASLGAIPLAPAMDPAVSQIVSEIQMRLSQLQMVSKSSIGMTVGLASKNIGLTSSQAKTSVKALINEVKNNPTATKECVSLSKASIEQINIESKNQLAFCSKNSQIQLKAQNQVQKNINLQIYALRQEINTAINQCTLENPVPTETSNVTSCVSQRADEIREEVSALEQTIQGTVQEVETNVSQIVNDGKTCSQQVQQLVQEQTQAISVQQAQCSITTIASVQLL